MTINHNSSSGKTTISLSWLETRQLISVPSVGEAIRKNVKEIVERTSFAANKTVTAKRS